MSFNGDLVQALRERQFDNTTPDGVALCATWSGSDIPVCAGEQKLMKSLGIGGFGVDSNCILIMVLDDLVPDFQVAADLEGKIPLPGQTVFHQGTKYRVVDTVVPPGLAFIGLALIDVSKGI